MQAWLVDLDGTLYRAALVKLAMGCELLLHGRSVIGPLRHFRREHEILRRGLAQEVASPFEIQLERAAARCGLRAEELAGIVGEWMLRRLARWIRFSARRDLLGAENLFDIVVANGEPGGPSRLKPWPDGYLVAAERLGVAPEDCLVIGDRRDADGEAALAAGMTFFLASRGVPVGDGSGNAARSLP